MTRRSCGDQLCFVAKILPIIALMIGFSAAAQGRKFRIYSIATAAAFIVFGILTTIESKSIEAGTVTPYVGVWERINMGAYMLWIVVLAFSLLQRVKTAKYN